jgi:hypothetical protein
MYSVDCIAVPLINNRRLLFIPSVEIYGGVVGIVRLIVCNNRIMWTTNIAVKIHAPP